MSRRLRGPRPPNRCGLHLTAVSQDPPPRAWNKKTRRAIGECFPELVGASSGGPVTPKTDTRRSGFFSAAGHHAWRCPPPGCGGSSKAWARTGCPHHSATSDTTAGRNGTRSSFPATGSRGQWPNSGPRCCQIEVPFSGGLTGLCGAATGPACHRYDAKSLDQRALDRRFLYASSRLTQKPASTSLVGSRNPHAHSLIRPG
jgi:hypothetical protein